MRPPAHTAVVLSLLLLLCGTHGSWGRPAYEEEDSADHLESSAADLPFGALLGQAGTPILERLLAEQEAARDVEGGAPVEGKRAETIAEVRSAGRRGEAQHGACAANQSPAAAADLTSPRLR